MANSQKLSELTAVENPEATDLLLISRDPDNYNSYAIRYDKISADLYNNIYVPLNDKIEALRTWFESLLTGEPSLTAISSDANGIVTNTPRKMVGVSAIYDLANVINLWKPRWQ